MEYEQGTNNFNISLSGDNKAELHGCFEKLAEGDTFGWIKDRFGISWLFNISSGAQPTS